MALRQRNRVKTKKGMWIVIAVALVLSVSMLFGQYRLSKQNKVLAAEQQELEQKIDDAKAKSESLDHQAAYMKTDEYVEEVAREKLGMVKDNEILFKAKDKQ